MATVQLVRYKGGRYSPDFAAALADVDKEVPGAVYTQGGWNADAVEASADTHNQDAADVSVYGKTREWVTRYITACRKRGLIALFRTTKIGKWGVRAHGFASYHIHVIANLWGHMSPGARAQALEYRAGRDGLRGKGPDAGGPGHTRDYVNVTWPSYLAAKAAKAKPKPKPSFPPGLKPDRAKPSARRLQQQLKRAGYMPKSVKEADNYGPATQRAVAQYHNANPKYRAKGKTWDVAIGPKGWQHLWTLG